LGLWKFFPTHTRNFAHTPLALLNLTKKESWRTGGLLPRSVPGLPRALTLTLLWTRGQLSRKRLALQQGNQQWIGGLGAILAQTNDQTCKSRKWWAFNKNCVHTHPPGDARCCLGNGIFLLLPLWPTIPLYTNYKGLEKFSQAQTKISNKRK
jgi:hypothetical protein